MWWLKLNSLVSFESQNVEAQLRFSDLLAKELSVCISCDMFILVLAIVLKMEFGWLFDMYEKTLDYYNAASLFSFLRLISRWQELSPVVMIGLVVDWSSWCSDFSLPVFAGFPSQVAKISRKWVEVAISCVFILLGIGFSLDGKEQVVNAGLLSVHFYRVCCEGETVRIQKDNLGMICWYLFDYGYLK